LFAIAIQAVFQSMAFLASVIPGMKMSMFDGFLGQMVKNAMGEFQEALISAESTLSSMFDIHRMSLEEIKQHYWQAYAPSYREQGQKVVVDPYVPFDEQLFPLPLEHDNDLIKIGNDYHGVLMLAMMPDAVGPDYLGEIRRTLPT